MLIVVGVDETKRGDGCCLLVEIAPGRMKCRKGKGRNGDPKSGGGRPENHWLQAPPASRSSQPADEQGCFAALVGKASKRILWIQPVRCQAVLAWRVGTMRDGVGEWGPQCADCRPPAAHKPRLAELLLSRRTRQRERGLKTAPFSNLEFGSAQPKKPSS